jgi:hypothetical protein
MPHQPTITELRINDIIICLKPAVTLLNEVDHSFGTPFVQAIANTTLALIGTIQVGDFCNTLHQADMVVQNVKKNKDECIQLMEHVHQVLYGIVDLHIRSEAGGSLPQSILDHLGKFTK